eukprot:TRINITY_DN3846_c0_g1_i1.p2 TRINITY_DN3846_c0_g1~~TRINITY_DN3846_c0_g1_i1.p2  ORF type:complete len:148 (-),score=9.48 TRINITY_DN3846_c0_g1_i1:87-530(-)
MHYRVQPHRDRWSYLVAQCMNDFVQERMPGIDHLQGSRSISVFWVSTTPAKWNAGVVEEIYRSEHDPEPDDEGNHVVILSLVPDQPPAFAESPLPVNADIWGDGPIKQVVAEAPADLQFRSKGSSPCRLIVGQRLSLIHISEPTRPY